VTSPLAMEFSTQFDDPAHVHRFHHKVAFNRDFDRFLRREWLEVVPGNVDEVRAFAERHPTFIAKVPVSKSGAGVRRYEATAVCDWDAFHADLLAKDEVLLEENIVQHADIAAYCPGTVNTTRVTTFVRDDGTVAIINMAQKFGRGQVSDQGAFGGFYVALHEDGRSMGDGYDINGEIYPTHPESGLRIADFRLPHAEQLQQFMSDVPLVVPQVRYVGWDVVMGPDGPILLEGNWGAGVFENKPTATGIRHGHLPRYKAAMGLD